MRKLIFILFCLISYPVYAMDASELTKIDYNTDNFFAYCTKDIDKADDIKVFSYCVGFYRGLSNGWTFIKVVQNKDCEPPSYRDFTTRFNSMFYRNQLKTEEGTLLNIFKVLDTFCNK